MAKAPKGGEGFKPIDPKKTGPAEISQMADRVVNHVQAATPSQRRAGARFYDRARRDAYHVSKGVNPGMAEDPRRPGRTRDFNAVMDERGNTEDMKSRQPGIDRAAHTIAALSPSGGGMTWRENPQAAHETYKMSPEGAKGVQKTAAAHVAARKAGSAVTTAKKAGEDTTAPQAAADAAQKTYKNTNVSARSHPDIAKTNLKRTSTDTIATAHDIASGKQDEVNSEVKTQAFAQNIARPRHIAGVGPASQRATVDGRSHNIAVGKDLPWGTTIGLGAPSRYKVTEQAHQLAAQRTGQLPHQAQATSWIQHKEAKESTASAGMQARHMGARGTGGDITLNSEQFGK